MGQYLAIGLVTECGISKKNLQKWNITTVDLLTEMQKQLNFCPEIYEFSETNDHYLFNLKSHILENQLVPFLKRFYPLAYRDNDFEDTIEMLQNAAPSTWLELASEKSREEFQFDRYAEVDCLHFNKPFKPEAIIVYGTILLSCEGKVSMEVFDRQFNFFKYCIQEAFSEFSIAKAVRVYISG